MDSIGIQLITEYLFSAREKSSKDEGVQPSTLQEKNEEKNEKRLE